MKTLGLIGGTTWVSTIDYYRLINQLTNERLGGHHSAKMYLHSIDFFDLHRFGEIHDWNSVARMFSNAAKNLELAGAECIVICANTPHKVAPEIQAEIHIPIIHIVEATTKAIKDNGIESVGLLGTNYTMEGNFYPELLTRHGIETLIPDAEDRAFIHNSIYAELAKEIFKKETAKEYQTIINRLVERGAKGIILGCTEIPLIVKQEDCIVPVFDTTLIHAKAAVEFALS